MPRNAQEFRLCFAGGICSEVGGDAAKFVIYEKTKMVFIDKPTTTTYLF
jgi:hypothetical protein